MSELTKLPNIGAKLEEQLNQIGIITFEELQEIGSKQAWLKIRAYDSSARDKRIMGLVSGIKKKKKSELSADKKAELKEFYYACK